MKNKRILITGIDGFVGTRLRKRLESLGTHVYGISKTSSSQRILHTDILDFGGIESFIEKKDITLCFHLAGVSLVEAGQEDPYHTFDINIKGTLNILELARRFLFEKVIIASTSHVYGNNRLPFREGYTPRPSRPYETSKACTDLIAQSYADTFHLPVLIPRFVNIYGPGDTNFSRLIPKTIRSVLQNKNPTMWGGDIIRDYLYIDDAIDAYIKLAQVDMKKIGKNRLLNFGVGNATTVKDIINKIIEISKKNVTINYVEDERAQEIKSQYVSYAKARRLLGWKPKTTIDEGLKKTIEWYKKHF